MALPLREVQLPPQSNSSPSFRCTGCHTLKGAEGFPTAKTKSSKGEKRAATCTACTTARQARNEKKKREKEEELPVISMGRFLSVLEGFRAGCAEECTLEARVATEELDSMLTEAKGIAQAVANAVSKTLGWYFK